MFNSFFVEKNIQKDLLLNFFKHFFKYFEKKKEIIKFSDDFLNKIVELGNFGKGPSDRRLSVFLCRKVILVNNIDQNLELINRIERLSEDSEFQVRLEISKSFLSFLNHVKENRSIQKSVFDKLIFPIIKKYIEKEDRIEILYHSLKVGLYDPGLQKISIKRLKKLILISNENEDLKDKACELLKTAISLLNFSKKKQEIPLPKEEKDSILASLLGIIRKYDFSKDFFNNLNLFSQIPDEQLIEEIKFWTKLLQENLSTMTSNFNLSSPKTSSLRKKSYKNSTNSNQEIKDENSIFVVNSSPQPVILKEKEERQLFIIKLNLFNNFSKIIPIFKKPDDFNKVLIRCFQDYISQANNYFLNNYDDPKAPKNLNKNTIKNINNSINELSLD